MKIGIKLAFIITVLNILGIAALASISMLFVWRQIDRLATENAQNIAQKNSETVRSWIGVYMGISRTMAEIMQDYETVPVEARRNFCDSILKAVMTAHPELTGTWSAWAPNALDGLDAEYANTRGTDASGRYIPVWSLDQSRNLALEPLTSGYETAGYYAIPMSTGTEVIVDPYLYNLAGTNRLITSMAIPIKSKGKVVGVCGIGIELSKIQEIVKDIKPFGDGMSAVFSAGGVVAAHFDESRIGKNLLTTEQDMTGPYLNDFAQAVKTGQPISFSLQSMNIYSVPFPIEKTQTPWTLTVAVSRKTIMAPAIQLLTIFIVIGVAMILVISAGSFIAAKSISGPIVYVKTVLKDIAEGDLTKQLNLSTKDEVAELADYLNFTIGKIKAVVIAIKDKTAMLFDTGKELVVNMTETAASVNEITANLQQIKTQAGNQSNSVTHSNDAMSDVADNIDALNQQIERQTDQVSAASESIENMMERIQEVNQTLKKNVENVHNLADASEAGRTGLQEVSADIAEVARESEGLLEINAVMENIASQTNLLSMNAAIEAAHAGDAGKGFAVVADEIRKLAENSGEQSKTISTVLNKIKESIDKITESTNAVLLKFDAINDEVKIVTEQELNIRNAMEEQGAGSKQILDSMNELIGISGAVKEGSQKMYARSRDVIQEGKNLLQLTMEITNGIQEMASGAKQINGAVTKVNEISVSNEAQIEQLSMAVSVFTVA
ncbi:MAG: methyl-accepting chemotaxis protein [Spirochaetaceae bacterium]|jgi:methyl-accepting chemotaxis protein|nr:methyl-accepting chemotaxis protein [Spirochaetaceae bacterium]